MRKLLILGAGGYGQTVADVAGQQGLYEAIAFLDDNQAGQPGVLGECGKFNHFTHEFTDVYPAFGNNTARIIWLKRLQDAGIHVPTLVHPTAYVSPRASLGIGVVVLPKAVVNTGTVVECGCIINIGALIDHDVVLEEGSHAAPGSIIKANNRIPAGTKIESGCVIENGQYPL